MAASRAPLGRGLASLLSSGGAGGTSVRELSVDAIVPNRLQPRKRFDPGPLQDLAATIRAKGVAQPVLVRRQGDRFELIAGERRWRAAKLAGLRTVPAMVREATDREALELALIENLQREDLNPIEEAVSFQALLKDLTQEDLAKRLGRDRTTIANALRLLKLPREVQDAVAEAKISAGHARAILQFDQPAAQQALYRRIVRDGLSVRAAEAIAQRQPRGNGGGRPRTAHAADADLSRALGTKVRVQRAGKRGRIVIEFWSAEEFERLADLLRRAGR
jgi:ParB family chromosome partitioning protein